MRSPFVRSNSCLTRLIAAGLLAVVVCASGAHAHQTKLSSTRMTIAGNDISTQVELNGLDLNVATGVTLTAADGTVLEDQLAGRLDAIVAQAEKTTGYDHKTRIQEAYASFNQQVGQLQGRTVSYAEVSGVIKSKHESAKRMMNNIR